MNWLLLAVVVIGFILIFKTAQRAPTVVISDVGLVNPSLATVKKTLADKAPHLL